MKLKRFEMRDAFIVDGFRCNSVTDSEGQTLTVMWGDDNGGVGLTRRFTTWGKVPLEESPALFVRQWRLIGEAG